MISPFVYPGLSVQDPDIYFSIKSAFGISPELLKSKTRIREIVEARMAVSYYKRTVLGYTFVQIGDSLNINHATVVHAVKTASDLLETDKLFRMKYEKLLEGLKKWRNQ